MVQVAGVDGGRVEDRVGRLGETKVNSDIKLIKHRLPTILTLPRLKAVERRRQLPDRSAGGGVLTVLDCRLDTDRLSRVRAVGSGVHHQDLGLPHRAREDVADLRLVNRLAEGWEIVEALRRESSDGEAYYPALM